MLKHYWLLFTIIFCHLTTQSQPISEESRASDSIKEKTLLESIGNGYFPTKYFNFDLRYLIKYNQYEGVRTGLGGITNDAFSEKYRINGYTVYGFIDHRFKYGLSARFRISEQTKTWLNFSYKDDLTETGSTNFLTDKRSFQFFEPRLLNIDLFHKDITKAISLRHKINARLSTETEFSISKIDPTYNYAYVLNGDVYNNFNISTAKLSFQWNPFDYFENSKTNSKEIKDGFPKFTLQYTKSFNDVLKGDFNFSKVDFRTIHRIGYEDHHYSEITLASSLASGNTPLTHLYHTNPNNITKEKILQRFSVAGLNSFETMFFNEFFSDKFATIQLKHYIKTFNISERLKPQIVLISRFAIGDLKDPEKHQNTTFDSLKKGYTESGFEVNKLLFGFGLSFAYRYGAYHLPVFGDNIAAKFTFNVSL